MLKRSGKSWYSPVTLSLYNFFAYKCRFADHCSLSSHSSYKTTLNNRNHPILQNMINQGTSDDEQVYLNKLVLSFDVMLS